MLRIYNKRQNEFSHFNKNNGLRLFDLLTFLFKYRKLLSVRKYDGIELI